MFLIWEALGEVLRLCPSFIDLVALKDICDDARDVFGEVFLGEPERVEGDLIPTYSIQFFW